MRTVLALSRRGFIGTMLAAGGSVLFYMNVASQAVAASSPAAILLNGWIRIAPNGSVSVFSRTTELGQGALTSLALIVAEELELDPASVTIEMAPVAEEFMDTTPDGPAYYVTWASESSRDMDRRMRKVAATVRALLLRAANMGCDRHRMQCAQWHRAPYRWPNIVLRCVGADGCNIARAARHRTQTARQLAPFRARNGALRYPRKSRR